MAKEQSSIFDYIGVLFIVLTIIAGAYIYWQYSKPKVHGYSVQATIRSIGFSMLAYAEDDIGNYKMPYPLPKGKEKVWGNSKDCWSTSVAEMLFNQKYFKKGDESILIGSPKRPAKYTSMYLNDNTIDGDKYWHRRTPLDFHLFCDKDLTSNISGKLILIATYDNDNIKNCQYEGKYWAVFYADKTTEIIYRKKFNEYDAKKSLFSVNAIEGSITGPGIILRKNIPESEGGPGTFGNFWGGGSTELMGKRDTDPVYKALVK